MSHAGNQVCACRAHGDSFLHLQGHVIHMGRRVPPHSLPHDSSVTAVLATEHQGRVLLHIASLPSSMWPLMRCSRCCTLCSESSVFATICIGSQANLLCRHLTENKVCAVQIYFRLPVVVSVVQHSACSLKQLMATCHATCTTCALRYSKSYHIRGHHC